MINEEFLWVQKYRPKNIKDCILPAKLKTIFQSFVDKNMVPNMTLSGPPGCGKTTVVEALCHELDIDFLKVNCSENGNIDTLRNDIRGFASTMSINGGRKLVLLDEADGLTKIAQQGLRAFIEEFSSNTSYCLTCNFPQQIIEAIYKSRCPIIEFKATKEEKPLMAKAMHKRVVEILKKENVPYDDKIVSKLIIKFFPDFRATLGELQKYSSVGRIDEGIISNLSDVSIKELIVSMKSKDFNGVRKWVTSNSDNDPSRIFRTLYDAMYDSFAPSFIPQFVLILADYMDQAGRSLDQEITLLAFLTCVMSDENFKVK